MIKLYKTLTKTDAHEGRSKDYSISFPENFVKYAVELGIFPKLELAIEKPKERLLFIDECKQEWTFSYFNYNYNNYSGNYRLAAMKKFIVEKKPVAGDEICLYLDSQGIRHIELVRMGEVKIPKFGDWYSLNLNKIL